MSSPAAPPPPPATSGSPRPPLRLGVIGCGRISQAVHLPAIAKTGAVTLVGVGDTSPQLAQGVAAKYDVPAFATVEELLGQAHPDAVLVAVPDRFHHPVVTAALNAGAHVLVEKPAAATSAQAAELADLADASGLKLQVGAMRRHDPGIAYARAAVPRLGALLSVSSWYRIQSRLRPPTEAALFPAMVVDDDVRRTEAEFKADRAHYLLNTHGAHVFDGLANLAGVPTSVRAQFAGHGRDCSWHGTGRLPGGGLASFEITADIHADYAEGMDLHGEYGQVSIRSTFPFFRQASTVRVHLERDGETRVPVFGAADPYQLQLEAFAAAIATNGPVDPSGADGVTALRLIEAVRDSAAADGKEVTP
ncbi:Predicted dehydrogenase [Actinopolymorpha cephalotaxi]|uniref:Dehydrogenase n=1 Tax=Actinopolymorpha cephalotaxi TaxID=504797 RepID=A0A1I2VCJ2_9ACTN|nr:Gfo/Idh/MocA family oxidoreductase [Actinopolymorpha cephalotaxi]NYH84796.1 putative dehydrogenase [Actinopolymorpha cephalotaxi]SFG85897.1 Predicted dehydrogenase [Actinopolymorpha cephalotaxi]